MRLVLRALLWSLLGSLLAALAWSLQTATLGQFMPPYGPPSSAREFFRTIPWAFAVGAYWASFIALVAFPAYALLFAVWLWFLNGRGREFARRRRLALEALAFALPPALMLAYGFGSTIGFPFDWSEAGSVFPLALVPSWFGIFVAERISTRIVARWV